MNKYVIYTILTGGYENVAQPLVIDERFDYILFSNDFKSETVGIWKVRLIPAAVDSSDSKRLSRYPKTHPATMLSEYEYSLYMDANIQIANRWVYERFVELADQNVEFAGIKLVITGRDDIYRHAYDICYRRFAHDYDTIVLMHELQKRGFPEHFGLNENNVIFRKHTKRMQEVDEDWWWWIINYSFRDQFSYMYCLWKYKVELVNFTPMGLDARNNSFFKITAHDGKKNVAKVKVLKMGLGERIRNYCRTVHYDAYCEQWVRLSKLPSPKLCLYLWGFIAIFICSPHFLYRILRKVFFH